MSPVIKNWVELPVRVVIPITPLPSPPPFLPLAVPLILPI